MFNTAILHITVVETCEGKPCGKPCNYGNRPGGVCDGKGSCRNFVENPCSVHGCEAKECGDSCLMGDIMGVCDSGGNCLMGGKPNCSKYFSYNM